MIRRLLLACSGYGGRLAWLELWLQILKDMPNKYHSWQEMGAEVTTRLEVCLRFGLYGWKAMSAKWSHSVSQDPFGLGANKRATNNELDVRQDALT
jgi:hypothetical protein